MFNFPLEDTQSDIEIIVEYSIILDNWFKLENQWLEYIGFDGVDFSFRNNIGSE